MTNIICLVSVAVLSMNMVPVCALTFTDDPTCTTYPYTWMGDKTNPFGECSGNGECTPVNSTDDMNSQIVFECQCDEGWTGRSDWISAEGFDCGVHIKTVQLLWGLNLLVTMMYVVHSMPYLDARYRTFHQAHENAKLRGEKMSVWINRAFYSLVTMFGIAIPAQICMCLLRLLDTEVRVGFDILPTILFFLAKFGLYSTSYLFSPALLAAVLRGEQQMEWIVKYNDWFSAFTSGSSIIIGVLPFVNMILADENGVQSQMVNTITYSTYMLSMALLMTMYSVQSLFVRRRVVAILSKSFAVTSRPETLALRQRLSDAQKSIYTQATTQIIPYLVLVILPVLYTKHDYALPLTWLAIPFIGSKAAKSASTPQKPATPILAFAERQDILRGINSAELGQNMSSAFRSTPSFQARRHAKRSTLDSLDELVTKATFTDVTKAKLYM